MSVESAEGTRKFGHALAALQAAHLALNPELPPDPREPFKDRAAFRARASEYKNARERVFDLFAGITGSSRRDARLRVEPLATQICLLIRVDWDGDVRPQGKGVRERRESVPSAHRARALNLAAVEALARFYLEGPDAVDPLVAKTQIAWERAQSARRRFRWKSREESIDQADANLHYWSLWRQWANTQERQL